MIEHNNATEYNVPQRDPMPLPHQTADLITEPPTAGTLVISGLCIMRVVAFSHLTEEGYPMMFVESVTGPNVGLNRGKPGKVSQMIECTPERVAMLRNWHQNEAEVLDSMLAPSFDIEHKDLGQLGSQWEGLPETTKPQIVWPEQ